MGCSEPTPLVMTWTELKTHISESLRPDPRLLAIYVLIYFSWGVMMNAFGQWAEIARFTYWWQIITCYILYMVPISLLLRKFPWHVQYAYGLIAMGVLEFLGYAFKTSYAFPGNLISHWFGAENFSLAMALFFAAYFPLGNALVASIAKALFKKKPLRERSSATQ